MLFFLPAPKAWKNLPAGRGFTLLEILVAMAILALLTLFLVGILQTGSQLWLRGESDAQYRIKARVILDIMGREIKLSTLPINQNNSSGSPAPSLQFLINPPGLASTYDNRDTIFFQAPVATNQTKGDLAEVGYLVEWSGTRSYLCRLLINPADAAYLVYSSPSGWLTSTVLDANIQPTNHYEGVFLNNVIGLWIEAYDASGAALASPIDSRAPEVDASGLSHPLPATVEIAMVVLDDTTAGRVTVATRNLIQAGYTSGSSFSGATIAAQEANSFIQRLPASLAPGATATSIKVSLDNYR